MAYKIIAVFSACVKEENIQAYEEGKNEFTTKYKAKNFKVFSLHRTVRYFLSPSPFFKYVAGLDQHC